MQSRWDDVLTAEHHMQAEERLLSDVDTYTDWLGGECMDSEYVRLGYIPSDVFALADVIDAATVPQLVAMLLYPSKEVSGRAAWELRERFVSAKGDYLLRAANDAAHEERFSEESA